MENLKKRSRYRQFDSLFSPFTARLTLVLFVLLSTWGQANAFPNSLVAAQAKEGNQSSIVVKGKVFDSEGEPLPMASIVIKGTQQGVTTNLEGSYEINVPSAESILEFRFTGMTTKSILVGNQTVINVTLQPDVRVLDGVIVTALNISKEKEALGYSIQQVKAEDLNMSGDNNVMTSLQGKVAGVNITTAGGIGGNSRIDIRGASSLRDNNAPLWVIDGVPFNNGSSSDGSFWGGVSRSGAAIDINPEDIETLTVLKGPSAAALYGSLAGNGVIMVTTKKGKKSDRLGIDLFMTTTFDKAAYVLDLQDEYGQGSRGEYDKRSSLSWGPRLDGSMKEDWTGNVSAYEAQNDRIKEFSQTGVSMKYGVAISGGTDKSSYRISTFKENSKGIFEGHKIEKVNFDLKTDYEVTDWLKIDTKISYIKSEGQNRPELGAYAYTAMFNKMPLNVRLSDLDPGFVMDNGSKKQVLYTTVDANYQNPYFMKKQRENFDERNRFFGYLGGLIKFNDDFKLRIRYTLDNYRYQEELRTLYGLTPSDKDNPKYETAESFYTEENAEFLFMYNKEFNETFSLGATFGGNMMKYKREEIRAKSGKMFSDENNFLGYGTNITATEFLTERKSNSLYGSVDFGFKDWIYLNLTGRNDWDSTLPKGEFDFFYPSANVSMVVSNMVELPDWYNFLKVRAGMGQTGKALEPYLTSQAISLAPSSSAFGDLRPFVGNDENYLPTTIANDIVAEMSTSYEVGIESKFFMDRLGFEVVYYTEETENQAISKSTDYSTGGEFYFSNVGVIENKGVEILLNTVPIQNNDFKLRADFSFATNETIVKEIRNNNTGTKIHSFFRDGQVEVAAIEGNKMGDILGTVWAKDEYGRQLVDEKGLPIVSQERKVLGNIQADWTGSVTLGAEYKGLFLNTLFDIRSGGDIMSLSERQAIQHGTAARTADNGRMPFFVENSVKASGEMNNELISAEEYYGEVAKVTEEMIYDASYVKWKELAIGYSVPKTFLKRFTKDYIKKLSISFVGRNLLYLYKDTPGTVPDASAYSSAYFAQAFDYSPMPVTRTYGFSIKVGL